jgi:hypothetical protein
MPTPEGSRLLHLKSIFLCHSSADKSFVRQLAADLWELGVQVWLDEWELRPGDSLHGSIGRALEETKFVGVVLSPQAVRSKWVRKELNQALARETRSDATVVVPILYKTVRVPPFLEDKLYLDFRKKRFSSLGHLAGIVHNIDTKLLSSALTVKPPQNLEELKDCLRKTGWESSAIEDRVLFERLMKFVTEAGYFERSERGRQLPDRFDIFPRFRRDKRGPFGGSGPVSC